MGYGFIYLGGARHQEKRALALCLKVTPKSKKHRDLKLFASKFSYQKKSYLAAQFNHLALDFSYALIVI